MTTRYVVLGLGNARSAWLSNVAAWSTAGALPVEFSKCVSAAEVAQRLLGLRPYSAVLVETVDDVVISAARDASVPVFLVSDGAAPHGVTATMSPKGGPAELLGLLVNHSAVVAQNAVAELAPLDDFQFSAGRLIAVCGAGGAGTSTIAIATAQHLASDIMNTGLVVLADFARNAEQGMLHDAEDVMPGVEELVEAHRHRRPSDEEVRSLTHEVGVRGYDLVLGVRKPSAWTAMPTAAVGNAVAALRRTYRTTVADITADFEGEADGGSRDVEERNALARVTALQADVVLVVTTPTMKGVHSASRIVRQLNALGVPLERIQIIVNRSAKRFNRHREIDIAFRNLVSPAIDQAVFLREAPVENALRDGTPLPSSFLKPLAQVCDRGHAVVDLALDEPVAVVPGSIGRYEQAVGQ